MFFFFFFQIDNYKNDLLIYYVLEKKNFLYNKSIIIHPSMLVLEIGLDLQSLITI